jgi:hypothetical protein
LSNNIFPGDLLAIDVSTIGASVAGGVALSHQAACQVNQPAHWVRPQNCYQSDQIGKAFFHLPELADAEPQKETGDDEAES